MLMNAKTRQSLGFDRVLQDLIPSSPFGVKCKSELQPYLSADAEKLAHELDKVAEMRTLLLDQPEILREIKGNLKQVKDIRRSVERCMEGGILSQVELFELKSLVFIMHSIAAYEHKLRWKLENKYKVAELPVVLNILDPQGTGIRSFYIYDEYSEKLKSIRMTKAAAEQKLEQLKRKAIEQVEQETGLKLKVTGEYTASKSQEEQLARLRSCESLHQSGETFANITYKIRPNQEMEHCRKEVEDLKGEELLEEAEVLKLISGRLAEQGSDVLRNIAALGELDLLIAKAELALRHRAVRPELTMDGACVITKGVNPIVQAELHRKGKSYLPIGVELTRGVTLITGANMGGKTVSMKMLGLLAVMAQHGLLVPAEHMSFQPFDFIYISCGDEQSIDLGLSTFGGEIKSITEVLAQTHRRGLVLLDELARGTNPVEGYALSYAIIDYLMQKPCISVVTTHLEGLEREGVRHLQVKGLQNVDFSSIASYEDIAAYMDFSLIEVKGKASVPQDAIKISKMMGMPQEVLDKAEQIMREK